jgi:hypothetical protein
MDEGRVKGRRDFGAARSAFPPGGLVPAWCELSLKDRGGREGPPVGMVRCGSVGLKAKWWNRPWICWTAVVVVVTVVVVSLGVTYRCATRDRHAYLNTLARVQAEGGRWEQVVGSLGRPDGSMKLNRFLTKDKVHHGVYWNCPSGSWGDMNEHAVVAEFDGQGTLVGFHVHILNFPNLTGLEALVRWFEFLAVPAEGVADDELPWLAAPGEDK